MLECECGSPAIEIVDATYAEDADGRPTGTAFERYECPDCGRTGNYSFGDGGERTSGCVTTREDPYR
jgi:transposase-like protein